MRDDLPSDNGFHYSREERLRLGGHDGEAPRPRSIWRNRTLLIILLDLILVLVIFGAANLLFPMFGSRFTMDGNLFRLRGVEVEDSIFITLVVERQADDPPAGTGLFEVQFALESESGRIEEISDWIADVAPSAPGERRVVRFEVPRTDTVWETAVAKVRHGDEERRLATRIIAEP